MSAGKRDSRSTWNSSATGQKPAGAAEGSAPLTGCSLAARDPQLGRLIQRHLASPAVTTSCFSFFGFPFRFLAFVAVAAVSTSETFSKTFEIDLSVVNRMIQRSGPARHLAPAAETAFRFTAFCNEFPP